MSRDYTPEALAALGRYQQGVNEVNRLRDDGTVAPIEQPEAGLKEGVARVPAQDIADAIVRYINARELAHFQRSQPHLNKAYQDLVKAIDAALGTNR